MTSSYSLLSRSGSRDYLRFLSHAAIFADVINASLETGLLRSLDDTPRKAEDIAAALDLDTDAVERVLNVLSGLSLSTATEQGHIATSEGRLLVDESPAGMGHQMRLFSGPEFRRAWQHLPDSLRTGRTGFGIAHGRELFEHLDKDPDASLRFNRGWQSVTAQVGHELAAHYDFSGISHLLDVGGNRGVILTPVLRTHPHLRATLFDLPASMVGADADLKAAGVRDRIDIVEGDATVSVPVRADCAMLKSVIHVCNDAMATAIMTQVATTLEPGSRAILIERVLLDTPDFDWSKVVDLTMLVITGGKERTIAHYAQLFDTTGFDYEECRPLPSGFSLIIGRKR